MIYMDRLLAYALMDDNKEKISLINMENTKCYNSTLNNAHIPIHPMLFSHTNTKVLSQYKGWDSIQSLGLHLIQREVFSALHIPQQAPSFLPHHQLTFCCSATPLLNNKLHRTKQYQSVGMETRKPCNNEVNNYGKDHEANLTHLMQM